jgi:hypothetical protein
MFKEFHALRCVYDHPVIWPFKRAYVFKIFRYIYKSYLSHIFLVPVPQYNGTMVPLGSVSLVSSILRPSDQDGWTVTKNANHCKTCMIIYGEYVRFFSRKQLNLESSLR